MTTVELCWDTKAALNEGRFNVNHWITLDLLWLTEAARWTGRGYISARPCENSRRNVWPPQSDTSTPDGLTLSEETFHLLTCLIVVDEDIEAQGLEALEELAGVSIRAVAYIHPC